MPDKLQSRKKKIFDFSNGKKATPREKIDTIMAAVQERNQGLIYF